MTETPGGWLLVLAVILPALGVLVIVLLGGRHATRVVTALLPVGLAVALAVAAGVWRAQAPLVYLFGGWAPPLGVALRADGLGATMLVATALLVAAIALFARPEFEPAESRRAFVFWVLLLALWSALAAVFVGDDLFNLYVALELLTFGAVPLVCLDGGQATIVAALRYLLFALLGSVLYLLGAVLCYGGWGTLDLGLLAARITPGPVAWAALALMTAGLIAKAALFPLHLWLPPAHAGAPAPASALLSALVVKAPYVLVIRLWVDVMPSLLHGPGAPLLGALGSGAVLVGSVMALRQPRLKLMVAYSTVAQIGYLFLLFPLAGTGPGGALSAEAWTGGVVQMLSHGFAKAAMFTGAGLIAATLGHDRIDGLAGIGRVLPVAVFGIGIAALSLLGLPPSGGFLAKWLLLLASLRSGQWWWVLVLLAGTLLAGGYLFRVLSPMLAAVAAPALVRPPRARRREAVVLALALASVLLGVVPLGLGDMLRIGRPFVAVLGSP